VKPRDDLSKAYKLVGGPHDGMIIRHFPDIINPDHKPRLDPRNWEYRDFVYEGHVYAPSGESTKSHEKMSYVGPVVSAA
jgi:hypothetical protein